MFRALPVLLLLGSVAAFAADPVPDAKSLDKTVAASLRDVHDRGADLYNQSKDYSGAYRLYEGALLAVKPLLAHRADVQKAIEEGLTAANKEPDVARKAFLLHEAIEKVRTELKTAAVPKVEPKPEPKPMPMTPVKPEPKPMPPVKPEPKPEPKPMPPVKPEPKPEPKPMPPVKPKEVAPAPKPKEPAKDKDATVFGKVTVKGQALAAGTVTFVSQAGADEKIATGVVKDGAYSVKGLTPGKYSIAVIGKPAVSVPVKFGSEKTSGLVLTVVAGANEFNIELK